MTQKQVLRKAFLSGRKLTVKQIVHQYNIASPSRVVERLRKEDGLPVTSRRYVDTKGRIKHKYSVGRPPVAVVAAGYRALAKNML